jgi:hypothetical protein
MTATITLARLGEGCLDIVSHFGPRTSSAWVSAMLREALTQQGALCVGDGQAILVDDDPIPEGADVAHLVFRR